jgi:hypothetical protein
MTAFDLSEALMARHAQVDGPYIDHRYSPLNMASEAFSALTQGPGALHLHGLDSSGLLPSRCVPLDALQEALLTADLPCLLRDEAWRAIAERARMDNPGWVVGAVGVAMPRLRRIVVALTGNRASDRADVESTVLSAYANTLQILDLDARHVEARLLWAAHRAGAWRLYTDRDHSGDNSGSDGAGVRFRNLVPGATTIAHIFT